MTRRLLPSFALCVALVAGATGGGCFFGPEGSADSAAPCATDAPEQRFALDPATGVCYEFASACDVPPEWPPCGPVGPPSQCMADTECPADMGCKMGSCVPRGAACMVDDDCPLTQHCEPQPPSPDPAAPTMMCVDNAVCADASQCPAPMWCDLDPTMGGDCDPALPDCGGLTPTGLCSRGAMPAPGECTSNVDCGPGELCPAQYGGCSAGELPPDGNICPAYCETACLAEGDCALGFTCNAGAVCGQPNPPDPGSGGGGMGVPLPCYGWCIPKTM